MKLKGKLKVGDEIEIEICPTDGEYAANTVDGQPFVEKFSVESLQKVIDNWKKDGSKAILCDIDHSSVETNDTTAAGWINSLFIDEEAKRLKGILTVSEKGADLLNGLEYRYISPVLFFTEDNYPYYLDSVSLTNTPRLEELKPVYNSKNFKICNSDETEDAKVDEHTSEPVEEQTKQSDETENTSDTNLPKEGKHIMDINELKTILGLPEEATEEDIRNTLAEIMEKLKGIAEEEARLEAERLQKEAEEKEAKLAEEAEEIANECGVEDEEKKTEIVNSYKANPELVKTVLNCFKKTPAKMVVNAAEAVKPELTAEKLKAEFEKLPGGQARVDFLMAHRGQI